MDDMNTDIAVEWKPEPAVSGPYLLVSITKLWLSSDVRSSTDLYKIGATLESPFGKETLVAFPLREVGDDELLPAGAISVEQWEDVIKQIIEVKRQLIKIAAAPITFS